MYACLKLSRACACRKIHGGATHTFEVHPEFEVLSIKALVEDASGLPIEEQRVLYKGRVMKDDDTLESAGEPIIRCPCSRSCCRVALGS